MNQCANNFGRLTVLAAACVCMGAASTAKAELLKLRNSSVQDAYISTATSDSDCPSGLRNETVLVKSGQSIDVDRDLSGRLWLGAVFLYWSEASPDGVALYKVTPNSHFNHTNLWSPTMDNSGQCADVVINGGENYDYWHAEFESPRCAPGGGFLGIEVYNPNGDPAVNPMIELYCYSANGGGTTAPGTGEPN